MVMPGAFVQAPSTLPQSLVQGSARSEEEVGNLECGRGDSSIQGHGSAGGQAPSDAYADMLRSRLLRVQAELQAQQTSLLELRQSVVSAQGEAEKNRRELAELRLRWAAEQPQRESLLRSAGDRERKLAERERRCAEALAAHAMAEQRQHAPEDAATDRAGTNATDASSRANAREQRQRLESLAETRTRLTSALQELRDAAQQEATEIQQLRVRNEALRKESHALRASAGAAREREVYMHRKVEALDAGAASGLQRQQFLERKVTELRAEVQGLRAELVAATRATGAPERQGLVKAPAEAATLATNRLLEAKVVALRRELLKRKEVLQSLLRGPAPAVLGGGPATVVAAAAIGAGSARGEPGACRAASNASDSEDQPDVAGTSPNGVLSPVQLTRPQGIQAGASVGQQSAMAPLAASCVRPKTSWEAKAQASQGLAGAEAITMGAASVDCGNSSSLTLTPETSASATEQLSRATTEGSSAASGMSTGSRMGLLASGAASGDAASPCAGLCNLGLPRTSASDTAAAVCQRLVEGAPGVAGELRRRKYKVQGVTVRAVGGSVSFSDKQDHSDTLAEGPLQMHGLFFFWHWRWCILDRHELRLYKSEESSLSIPEKPLRRYRVRNLYVALDLDTPSVLVCMAADTREHALFLRTGPGQRWEEFASCKLWLQAFARTGRSAAAR
mmetsp:Transcript_47057/g.150251  ORF Transcript_47057/g.150251 Transcript_47057/m.150251 type:complete len:680 (-) Transcript_47057:133-2172(-)